MKKLVAAVLLGIAGTLTYALPTHAASATKPTTGKTVNWSQHDTAVYVVSTLNLLRTHSGKSVVAILGRRMNVTHYDVYADQMQQNLYFIQLRRDDGTVVGAFAYQMGWAKPKGISGSGKRYTSAHVSSHLVDAYNGDQKLLIGSFTSTLPS